MEVQTTGGTHEVITVFGKFPVYARSSASQGAGQMATTGDILPSGLPRELRRQVENLVLDAHRALSMDDGITQPRSSSAPTAPRSSRSTAGWAAISAGSSSAARASTWCARRC
ncbi:hypothetical protein NQP46_00225 [Streptomyces albus]|nr:hypothetical protein NQP46_00225 [Streptomyces albus]